MQRQSRLFFTAKPPRSVRLTVGWHTKAEDSKWYFLKSLHEDSYKALSSEIPHALVTGVKDVSGKSNNNYVLDASKFHIKALQEDLKKIKDPRSAQGRRYDFLPFLSLCIAAVISGYSQYRQIADWIKRLPADERVKLGMRGDASPSESAVGNLLRKIDPEQLQKTLSEWLLKTYKKPLDLGTVILDGKAIRATSSIASEQASFLNVFANELGIVIEHQPTSKGGGEKTTAKTFIRNNDNLEGKIVLADAIHTDRQMIADLEKKSLLSPNR